MLKALFTIGFLVVVYTGTAQVKIRSGTTAVNPAAVLKLSKNIAAAQDRLF